MRIQTQQYRSIFDQSGFFGESEHVNSIQSEEESELALIKAVCDGERDKFEILYSSYERQIFSYVFNMMNHHPQDTEDICSEIWIKAYNKLRTFNGKHKFFSWIYSIARNTCYDALRKKQKNKAFSTDSLEVFERPSIAIEDVRASKEELYSMLNKLKKKDKNLLVLRYLQGYQPREIADILGESVNKVSVNINRAKKRAQKIITSSYAQ